MNEIASLSDHFKKIVNQVAHKTLMHTMQLYTIFDNKEPVTPSPIASAVLLEIDGIKYLVTAAHIYNKLPYDKVGFMIQNDYYKIAGQFVVTNPSKSQSNNKIDLAIVRLFDEVVDSIEQGFSFFSMKGLALSNIIEESPKYLLVGFPVSRSKLNLAESKLSASPFVFLTKESRGRIYKSLRFSSLQNVILDYRKRKIKSFGNSPVVQGPDPYGISGSGLWYIPNFLIAGGSDVPYIFAGVMIEWRKDYSVVVATKPNVLLSIIKSQFS